MKRTAIFSFFVLFVQLIPGSVQNATTTAATSVSINSGNTADGSTNVPVTFYQSSSTSSSSEPMHQTTWEPALDSSTTTSEYSCSDIYNKLQYGTYNKLQYGTTTTYAKTSSSQSILTSSTVTDTFPSLFTSVGTTMSRRKRGIPWDNIYYYSKFPWWDDSINGTTSWYTEYNDNRDELEKSNLPLNGIAYTGSCEKLVCIGRENINRTGEIHPKCCLYNGELYHHGYPMYKDNCRAQVCSEGNWLQLDYSDPYCCSAVYYNQYKITTTYAETSSTQTMRTTSPEVNTFASIFTTFGTTRSRRKRGIYWEYLTYYSHSEKFPWWFDSINGTTSWFTEYNDNKNELDNSNLPLNGIAYTGSCEKLVCIGRENINRTGETHAKCCFYNGEWYHHGYPMYNNDCAAQVCSEGNWLLLDYSDPYCCSNVYYTLGYGKTATSTEQVTTTTLGMDTSKNLLTRSKRRTSWDYISYFSFPWWDDDTGDNNWYQEYNANRTKYFSNNLALNEIAYTGSCEKLICIGRDNVQWTGEIHSTCCYFEGDWYHYGYPMYKNDCSAQVCDGRNWVKINYSDPYCCTDIYYKLRNETTTTNAETSSTQDIRNTSPEVDAFPSIFTTFGTTMSKRKRGINWDFSIYISYYKKFPWWYDSINGTTSWKKEYFDNKNELYDSNPPLNGIAYTGSCEKLVCIGKQNINRTGEIHPKCCFYNDDWYHHGHPMYNDDCKAQVCNEGNWLQLDHFDKHCCVNLDIEPVFPDYNYNYYEYFFYNSYDYNQNPQQKVWYKLNETRVLGDCQEVTCASRDNWVPTGEVIPNSNIPQGCDFDDILYNHTARLPGCFQVFCSRGMWVQMGHIDKNCSLCTAYWDPHLITFDGHSYDYHGTCEYAMAQYGSTTSPQYAVNSEFMECWNAACVGPSTFKDSPMTVVKMGAFGRYTPDLYKILVNGVPYEIPDKTPRFVKEGTTEHPVLAWRYRYGCIRLLGSSKIAVEKCGSSLSVWASPEFHGELHGLCGYFDGDKSNDFSKRDGTTSPLNKYPAGEEFPDSWETTCAMGGLQGVAPDSPLRRIKRSESGNCTLEKNVEDNLRSKCNQSIDTSGSLSQEMINILIGNCIYDTCSIYQNTSGNASVIEKWIGEVQTTVEDISDIENKTSETDVIPEILFQDPYEPNIVDPVPSQAPLDTNNYTKREKLMRRLIMKVKVGRLCKM